LSADQGAHPFDDDLQDIVERGKTRDLSDGRIEGGVNLANAVRHGDIRIEHRRRG
jgi:hypothetical protein